MDVNQGLRLFDIAAWPVVVVGLTLLVVWRFGEAIRFVITSRKWEMRGPAGLAFLAGDPVEADSLVVAELASRGGEAGQLALRLEQAIDETQRLWELLGTTDGESRARRIAERAKRATEDNLDLVRLVR